MHRFSLLTVATLLVAAPAAAQELPLPPLPLPPVVVIPVPQPGAFPLPVPVGVAPAPVPPQPGQYAPPPPPLTWSPAEMPPPEPPPAKKIRGVVLAVDLGLAWPIQSPDTKGAGTGGDFRVGYRFGTRPVWVSLEGDVGVVGFPRYDWAMRVGGGGHLGIDAGLVEPSVYAFAGGFVNTWKQGPGVRAGASLDFRPGRYYSPGIHVDYNGAGWNTGAIHYVSTGVHMGFIIGK